MLNLPLLAIYSSNLGEFFAVRVAQHRNLLRIGKKTKKELHLHPRTVLKEILSIVNKQQEEFSDIFENQIVPELKGHGIHLQRRLDLTDEQKEFVESYFKDNMLPYVQPVLLVGNKIRPFLTNSSLYLTVILRNKGKLKASWQYAIVKIPSEHLPRFVELPSEENHHDIIMIDDIVRHSIAWLFPGYDVLDTYSIKLTRDAELYIDDEFSGDLIQKIKGSLQKRNVGPAARLVYDRAMPKKLLEYLEVVFEMENFDFISEGRYHNNFDFFGFPNFGMDHLTLTPLEPLSYRPLEDAPDFFKAMKEKDHLINVPYHTYESVIQFFEKAADDPEVTHIKIIQYRVASSSRIMKALMRAVNAGKNVSAFIEVKARFDEEANLRWGEKLEKAGVEVRYSFPGLKVHAKVALVRKMVNGAPEIYTYLSTGNFHEKTAKIYSDFGFFTTDPRITSEVTKVFTILETVKLPSTEFEHLLVGQFNLRSELSNMILREIENAQLGRKAEIILKLNNLQDPDMIDLLYQASQKGVRIKLIIRGICCLVPGVKGISENITCVSIVDRYLEHARIFVFHSGGEEKIYLSSADWMTRNLSYRIETVFPVYDESLKSIIKDLISIQLSDNVKSRIIDKHGKNEYVADTGDIPVQSQIETYYYFKRLEDSYLKQIQEAAQLVQDES